MLNNISTQATLLLGFSLAAFGADLLPTVLDDTSTFCFYKTQFTMAIGSIFLLCNASTLGFCLLVILFSSLLILRSQTALLYVGGSAAVWRTHQLMQFVYQWYGLALASFISNAMLLMWIYLGFGLWHEVQRPADTDDADDASGADATLWMSQDGVHVKTYDGRYLIRCLDPMSDEEHMRRDTFGTVNIILCQLLFALFIVYGYRRKVAFDEGYALDAAKGSAACKREEQQARAQKSLQLEVEMARRLRDDAKNDLKAARKRSHGAGDTRQEVAIKRIETRLAKSEKRYAKAKEKFELAEAEKRMGEGVRKAKRPRLLNVVRRLRVRMKTERNGRNAPPARGRVAEARVPVAGSPPPPQRQAQAQGESPVSVPFSPPLASLLQSAEGSKPEDGEVDSMA